MCQLDAVRIDVVATLRDRHHDRQTSACDPHFAPVRSPKTFFKDDCCSSFFSFLLYKVGHVRKHSLRCAFASVIRASHTAIHGERRAKNTFWIYQSDVFFCCRARAGSMQCRTQSERKRAKTWSEADDHHTEPHGKGGFVSQSLVDFRSRFCQLVL